MSCTSHRILSIWLNCPDRTQPFHPARNHCRLPRPSRPSRLSTWDGPSMCPISLNCMNHDLTRNQCWIHLTLTYSIENTLAQKKSRTKEVLLQDGIHVTPSQGFLFAKLIRDVFCIVYVSQSFSNRAAVHTYGTALFVTVDVVTNQ